MQVCYQSAMRHFWCRSFLLLLSWAEILTKILRNARTSFTHTVLYLAAKRPHFAATPSLLRARWWQISAWLDVYFFPVFQSHQKHNRGKFFSISLASFVVLCGTRIATVTWRPVPAFHRPAERFGYRGNSIFYLGDCIVCCCCKWSQAKKRSKLCLMVVDMLLSTCQWCVYLAQVVAGAQGEVKCVEAVRELKMNCNSKCSIISFDPTGGKHNRLKPFLMSQSMWAGGIDLSHLKYYHNTCRYWIVW